MLVQIWLLAGREDVFRRHLELSMVCRDDKQRAFAIFCRHRVQELPLQ